MRAVHPGPSLSPRIRESIQVPIRAAPGNMAAWRRGLEENMEKVGRGEEKGGKEKWEKRVG